MILLDMHPATFIDGDGREHSPVRVVITPVRLRVWRAVGRETELVADEPHDGVRLESRHPLVGRPVPVTLSSGVIVRVTRQRGCGCGSPLKRLQPSRDD